MAFQIKDFVSITASILNHARASTSKVTDWMPGSVVRTIIESPAIEIEELYLQMFLGLRDAIPTAVFKSFNFDKLPSMYAHGIVTVSKSPAPSSSSTILLGTTFSTIDNRIYTSTAAVTWAANAPSVNIPVVAAAAGLAYNTASGGIISSPFFDTTYTISNYLIDNGRDAETDTEQELRFASYVASISGGTVAACLYAASSSAVLDASGNIFEYVTRVGHAEYVGRLKIFIYSSAGVPTNDLVSAAQLKIDGYKDTLTGDITPGYSSAGVSVVVYAMQELVTNVSVGVEMLAGFTLTAGVINDLSSRMSSMLSQTKSGDTLYLGDINTGLLAADGVKRIVVNSDQNIICPSNKVLVLGTLTAVAL